MTASLTLVTPPQPSFDEAHHRIVFERFRERIPDNIGLAMREAATCGAIFAERIASFEERPKAEFDAALATELDRRTSTVDGDGCKLLLTIAFLVRGVETVRDPAVHKIEGYRPHSMAIRAQHAITRAKIGFTATVIRELWDSHEVVGVTGEEWRKTLTGGFRVATVADRLSVDAFSWPRPVYLPTVDEDRASIDLFVTNGLGNGLTLQVKSHDEEGIVLQKIVDEPCGGELVTRELRPDGSANRTKTSGYAPGEYARCRQLWKATQDFNERFGVAWEPVIAYVGRSR